jgi:hypothetical protein
MAELTWEAFVEATAAAGLGCRRCGIHHWQILGGQQIVNVWPDTKKGFRFQAGKAPVRTGDLGEAILAAGKPSVGFGKPQTHKYCSHCGSPPGARGLVGGLCGQCIYEGRPQEEKEYIGDCEIVSRDARDRLDRLAAACVGPLYSSTRVTAEATPAAIRAAVTAEAVAMALALRDAVDKALEAPATEQVDSPTE